MKEERRIVMIPTTFRKSTANKFAMFLVLVLTCLLIAGCTEEKQGEQSEEPNSSVETNIKTVEDVLKEEFTGPNKEYKEIAEKDGQEKFDEMNSYLKSKYEPYFTEPALESFINSGGAHIYQFQNDDYQMSVENIEVKQSDKENGDNIYRFTLQVALESPEEDKTLYDMSGEAIFSEEGKIGRLQIVDKDQQLSNKLNGLN